MNISDPMHDRSIALADCNNFFVSCERRADNSLDHCPVLVLSSNDGCVISRCNEVKKMGVKIGIPYFKVKDILAQNGVKIRSTNMALYQKVSAEVMATIRQFSDTLEIYSIDECFFSLRINSIKDPLSYCRKIKEAVWKESRIPISVGIAPTKTLCKLAVEYAKKNEETGGVYWLQRDQYSNSEFMSRFDCSAIWGIGRKSSDKLLKYGVRKASDFIKKDEMWVKKNFNISALYTLWELKGFPAHGIDSGEKPPKSIMVSRSFGTAITTYEELLDPLLCFTVSAGKQLRKAKQMAGKLSVFISTSRFNEDNYYANSKEISFDNPCCTDSELMECTEAIFEEIFMPGYEYKKCGVILSNFVDVSAGIQTSLFEEKRCEDEKNLRVASAVDSINNKFKQGIIKPASLFEAPDQEKKWAPKSEFHSKKVEKKEDSSLPDGIRFQNHSEDFVS
ncbi:MAG: Y-family DNA polymerase [Synergistaceae bacterium]